MLAEPDGRLAAALVEWAEAQGGAGVIHVARSEARAARLRRAARALAPRLAVIGLPAWDCLPYDRASPSRQVMGERMAALARLTQRADAPCLLIAGIEAVTQRLPPGPGEMLCLRVGDGLDPEALEARLRRMGYAIDDTAELPGEAALRGEVADLFPPGDALPMRVEHAEGRITALRRYDPLTQRSVAEAESVEVGPASELPPEAVETESGHVPGLEHALAAFHPRLVSVFDLLPDAALVLDPEVEALRRQRQEEIADAYRAALALPALEAERKPTEPAHLYLDEAAWQEACAGRRLVPLDAPEAAGEGALPRFAAMAEPEEAFLDFVAERLGEGLRVAVSGPEAAARRLARLVQRRLDGTPQGVEDWVALCALPAGSFALISGVLPAGFIGAGAVVVAPSDVRRPRRAARGAHPGLPGVEEGLQPGDAVIHLDHGLGALQGVETVALGETQADCLRLAYAGGAGRLVPFDEIDRLWRYGGDAESVTLDRLESDAWPKRRAEVEAQVAQTAAALLRLVRAREQRTAAALRPPPGPFGRFVARFPHQPTEDQEAAIEAVLADLAAGRPMDRLVCGDVGFGKTEVALRAAAVAALSGHQVAVLAPTTVLVRQHLATFRRRFAGLGIRIEALSRLSAPAAARATRAGLADGSVRIVIGTQALAGRQVRFRDLALVVIDEEQRFGARQKAMLRRLGAGAHVLTLTATPIPRTLQTALAGLQDLSVIATPPARRWPVRTVQAALDDALLAGALRRERRRSGQSFVVCPRIEDIAPMRARIRRVAPELTPAEAHGDMRPEDVDEAMVRFADGGADVLLSTNIVETGLDVPRANTMLVWRADRFGLAQLHQLRGRVGRGRARGAIWLLTDPDAPPGPATQRRLRALEAYDRVGAGFAISARDLDLRGAGDLLGEEQAGHVKLIGLDLYQHLLDRALRAARGEAPPEDWTPALAVDVSAFLPQDYVADEALRVGLYTRLGEILRRDAPAELEELAEEIEDRFGPPPEPVQALLTLARLRAACRRLGVARLEAGPAAAAATFHAAPPEARPPLERRGERLILHRESHTPAQRLATAEALLAQLCRRQRA